MTRTVQGFEETATNAKPTMAGLESELTEALRNYQGDQAVAFWDLRRRLRAAKAKTLTSQLEQPHQNLRQSLENRDQGLFAG